MRRRSVVGLLGGLGNQLFQVSLGFALEAHGSPPVLFDASAYRSMPHYLGLADLGLRLPLTRATARLPHPTGRLPRLAVASRRVLGPARFRQERPGTTAAQLLADAATPAWYSGYWQLPALVDAALPRLRQELALQGPPPEQRIAVHVRRGDMLASVEGTPASAYRAAVVRLQQGDDLPVEVYSDDVGWCREHLGLPGARYREGGSPAADLRALADSARLVCSPSTFSWWAAVLRDRDPATVVAPARFPSPRDLRDPRWLPL